MKRLLTVLFFIMLTASLSGQKILKATKNNYNNFGLRTTKVVLQGTTFTDLLLTDAVKKNWIISPYEFCYIDEYEKIKEDTSYNFLLRTDGIFNKEYEPKLEYLTLIKGGPKFQKGLFMSAEFISLPFQSIGDDSGNIHPFIPAYLNIIQDYILKVQKGILISYSKEASYADPEELNGRSLIFGNSDFGYETDGEQVKWEFRGRAEVTTDERKGELISDRAAETAVSLIIFPLEQNRGYCYKLLIGTDNHRLYMFKKHRITSGKPPGFTKKDVKKISYQYRR